MSELEELIAAATAIVSERWGPCSDYVCEADRAGLGTECTASRGVVADVVAAILAAGYVVLPPGGVTTPIWGLRHDYERGVGAPASFYETCGSGPLAEALARNAAADGDGVLIRRQKVDWPDGSKLTTAWSPVDPPVAAVVEPITQEVGSDG